MPRHWKLNISSPRAVFIARGFRLGILLVLLAATITVAVVARVHLIEARELLAEVHALSRLAEANIVKGRKDEAIHAFTLMQREIMQYGTVRHVRHSSLRYSLYSCINLQSPQSKKLDVYDLSASEKERLLSYTKELEQGSAMCTDIENLLYKKWPGSREHWPAWGGPESGAARKRRLKPAESRESWASGSRLNGALG